MKSSKRFISMILVFAMCMATIHVNGGTSAASGASDTSDIREASINAAAEYIKSEMNDDGSLGNSCLINDTAEAAFVLSEYTESDMSAALAWLFGEDYDANTDTMARMVTASADTVLLEEIMKTQNEDGGFGLSEGYRSDILDSVLVLEAINAAGSGGYEGEAFRLACYISRQADPDGSFSYTKFSDGDIILSAMALEALNRYVTESNVTSELITNTMDRTYGMLAGEFNETFPEETMEENLYAAAALTEYKGIANPEDVIETLSDIQGEDGSFLDDVHMTNLAVRLLGEMDMSHMVRVYDMQTANTDTAYYGEDTEINVDYAISYSAQTDVSCLMKCIVTNGDEVIYENDMQEITLYKDENISYGSMEGFFINEDRDDGITVTVLLYCGDTVIGESAGSIRMENRQRPGETELTDFTVSLNHYYTCTDAPAEVSAEYKLLYTTNVKKAVEIELILSKDGEKVAVETHDEEMVPEKDLINGTGLTFEPDVSEAGTYEITARCLYEGSCVAESTAEYIVADKTGGFHTATGSDAEEAYTVKRIGPRLSDYCLYAGNETEVGVSFEILYESEESIEGKAVTEVTDGESVLKIQETPVTLAEGGGYYESAEIFSLPLKEPGEYKVTVTFYDAEGKELNSGYRTVNVTEKKKISLISQSGVSDAEDRTVDISWNDISDSKERYNYRLYRRYDGTDWESRSIWNERERINVLNVYPTEPYLSEWMTTTVAGTDEPAGMGIFDITSVHFSAFNRTPDMYMYDENGSFIYDVIFFGSADCNGGYDLSARGAECVQDFVDSGRGVLFGHDTITGVLYHTYLNSFAEQLGLRIYYHSSWNSSSYVSVNTMGTLTNFPWTVRGTLTVPTTHSTGQYICSDTDTIEWMSINTCRRTDSDGYHDSFYLVTRNNLGMIQTGHSNGRASDDERKVLANTLFYLHQVSGETTAKDNSFYDLAAPDVPEVCFVSTADRTAVIRLSAEDRGTKYQYYIEAVPGTGGYDAGESSNIMTETALSGIKGYLYEVTDSADENTGLPVYDENNEVIKNVIPADADGTLTAAIEIPDFNGSYYLHAYAVDYENNISGELVIPLDKGQVETAVSTDKESYVTGETVVIETETAALPFAAEADMTLSLYDEGGNYVKEIYYENGRVINAGEPYMLNRDLELLEDETGEYSVRIEWIRDGSIIASDSAAFTVSDKETDDEEDRDDGSGITDETDTDRNGDTQLTDEEGSMDGSREKDGTAENGADGDKEDTYTDRESTDRETEGTENMEDTGGESTDTGDVSGISTAVIMMFASFTGAVWLKRKKRKDCKGKV